MGGSGGTNSRDQFMKTLKLPLKEAIEAAVKQNIERDRRMEKEIGETDLMPDPLPQDELDLYYEEVRYLLETTGENYLPDYPDHPHVVIEDK
jgi:hypothetical protein